MRPRSQTEAVDKSLLEELIESNHPFRIETASGRVYEIPHRDFVAFSPRKTALFVFFEENNEEHYAIVPLLTITSAQAKVAATD
jgi:hypothetical protein